MWVKVLPADLTKDVYFKELPDGQSLALHEMSRIVAGYVLRVYTDELRNTFQSSEFGPRVVMLVNEDGGHHRLPPNKRATKYAPNEYGVEIRGDAILVGESNAFVEGEDVHIFVSMPEKWKAIYDMETVAAEGGNDYEKVHSKLDDLLLSVADPDVRKMYEEIRDQFKNWPTA